MSSLDQFESMFRSADRPRYEYTRVDVSCVLLVTDLDRARADAFAEELRPFLVEIAEAEWTVLDADGVGDVAALRERVERLAPDLVITYRNLRSDAWRWAYSMGVYLNVLARQLDVPVLVVPNPHEIEAPPWKGSETDEVMVLTDHLTGDDRLLDWGVRFVRPGGKLFLAHLEDDQVFERYLTMIGKLPSIDTEMARGDIKARLLAEPLDYAKSCAEVLAEQGHLTHEVVPLVQMGHRLSEYARLIEEHAVDLLVFHAKDQDQLALHGKAYSLAVQLRDVPILMI
jgi:hypothetical protein